MNNLQNSPVFKYFKSRITPEKAYATDFFDKATILFLLLMVGFMAFVASSKMAVSGRVLDPNSTLDLCSYVGAIVSAMLVTIALYNVGDGLRRLAMHIDAGTFLFASGRVLRAFEKQEFFWIDEFVNTYGHDCSIEICAKETIAISMSFNPITVNPKVRSLKYGVTVETRGTPERALQLESTLEEWKKAERKVKFHLFNFQEETSSKLGELFNPVDAIQQQRFETLVREYLEPHLKDTGIVFKKAEFSFPS